MATPQSRTGTQAAELHKYAALCHSTDRVRYVLTDQGRAAIGMPPAVQSELLRVPVTRPRRAS